MANVFEDLFEDLFQSDTFDDILESIAGPEIQSAIETERAGREEKREARRQATVITESAEEQAELLRKRAQRAASTQRARIGAAGVRGTPLLVVQESLLFSFDEIARLRRGASQEAAAIAKRGRRQARAAKKKALIQVGTALVTAGIGGAPGTAAGAGSTLI